MDRDTRTSARDGDLEPEARLELARRHLRASEPLRALRLLEEGDAVGAEASEVAHLQARAQAGLGRWRSAAQAARRARLGDPEAVPAALLEQLRVRLDALDPLQPDPPLSERSLAEASPAGVSPPGASSLEPSSAEELRAEQLWLRSWLGGDPGPLLALTDDARDWARLVLAAGHEALAPELIAHSDPFVRARAQEGLALREGAAALGALPAPGPERELRALALAAFGPCAPGLRSDPQPLVRYRAEGSPELAVFPREPMPTRLFSAHGQDFQTGTFLAAPVLDASSEARLRLLTPSTLALIDRLCGEAFPWRVRGRGYGLARPQGLPEGELEARVALLNLLEVFPLRLRLGRGHMFDILSEREASEAADPPEEVLARYLGADLCRHPARLDGGPEHPLIYARALALFRPTKERESPPPAPELLEPILRAADARYSSVGQAALRHFVAWRGDPPRQQRRRDPYRT